MISLLIVDDDTDVRNTLKERIEVELPEATSMKIYAEPPFPNIADYASYIAEHDISALILDERLNERPIPSTGIHVAYFGHDVIGGIRKELPDFPVFVVTTYSGDDALVEKFSEFEAIVDRDDFELKAADYTKRIIRAASRFRDSMQQHLELLNRLSIKALDPAVPLTELEQQQLAATRELLGLPFQGPSNALMSDLVEQAKSLAAESKELLNSMPGE
jgi:CheY-like chemotaxis protein